VHRASPTLLILATCLAVSLVAATPAAADDSVEPAPTTSPEPSPAPSGSPFGDQPSPFATEGTPLDPESQAFSAEREGDTLISVNVAMPGQTDTAAAPSVRPPRARLPLRLGHYGTKVALMQARLAWLGYEVADSNLVWQAFGVSTKKALKQFQAKNWLPTTGKVNKRTWRMLKKQSGRVGVLPQECTEVRKALCIDKTSRTLRYVVKGKVKMTTDARFGQPGMETDEGVFAVKEKSFNHTSSIYGSWMPRAMFFNGDEAVHYSPDFAAYGYLHGSHGCVGIRDMEFATRLFEKVDVGTRVYVYWS
jgi:hypothetical protein